MEDLFDGLDDLRAGSGLYAAMGAVDTLESGSGVATSSPDPEGGVGGRRRGAAFAGSSPVMRRRSVRSVSFEITFRVSKTAVAARGHGLDPVVRILRSGSTMSRTSSRVRCWADRAC